MFCGCFFDSDERGSRSPFCEMLFSIVPTSSIKSCFYLPLLNCCQYVLCRPLLIPTLLLYLRKCLRLVFVFDLACGQLEQFFFVCRTLMFPYFNVGFNVGILIL